MASGDTPTLSPRQAAFVTEYLVDLNGTQAAIRAGYASNSAAEQASETLRIPKVADAIERGKAERLSRVNITADTVLHEMSALALARIEHFVVDDNGQVTLAEGAPQNAMAAIQSVKRRKTVRETKDGELIITYDVELRLWDKPGSLKLMGKHAGVAACFDSVRLAGHDGGKLELKELSTEELLARHKALSEATE